MQIDEQKIIDAILADGFPPLASESAAALAQHWIEECLSDDLKREVVAVETGFVMWLEPDTCVVGVQDLLTREFVGGVITTNDNVVTEIIPSETTIVGNEWKTTSARSESDWLDDIKIGSQVAIYALALHRAQYYERKTGKIFVPAIEFPRIRVRAIKKQPMTIWPREEKDGLLEFSHRQLDVTKDALLAKAEAIRASRKKGALPWQLPGIWCTNKYRRTCEYHEDCIAQRFPEGWGKFDSNNPAAKIVLPQIKRELDDPNLVILSASDYASYSSCLEAGRRNGLNGNREESMALDVGGAFHAALASLYDQIREFQQDTVTKENDNVART